MLSVVVDDSRDPAWNLALDEALLRSRTPAARSRGTEPPWPRQPAPPVAAGWIRPRRGPGGSPPCSPPVLRVWQNAPSVVVGRFQEVSDVVDLTACSRDGVRLVRRASGGGAVCLDSGTLVFTLVRGVPRGPATRRAGVPAARCAASDPRAPDPRSGARPGLDALVAAAVQGLGLPAAALGNGTIRAARLRTRWAELTHVAVHVTQVRPFGRCYLAPGTPDATPPTLAELGLEVSLDAVRAAVLTTIVDVYGIAAARRPDRRERETAGHLHAVRYGDVTWNLTGRGPRHRAERVEAASSRVPTARWR
ncbi:lipoate--protein ligase family protein [Actinomadura kijaniata]|uniref:lipoate--protein ligase family protein n=1 Tax=Actinomadura kijaniata TaxID=46161 RepID=UPI003F1ACE16